MSAFLTELDTECVDDLACGGRGIWKAIAPFVYHSDLLRCAIVIEVGFLTDYASVPRVPFAYWLFGDSCHKASVVHDWLLSPSRGCDEQTADRVFLETTVVEGIPWWRLMGVYLGVDFGGETSWEEDGRSDGHSILLGRII
jgi:hypothetical protein